MDHPNDPLAYSENLIMFTGAKGVHIFDIEREVWIWSSSLQCHQHEYITSKVEDNPETSSDDSSSKEEGEVSVDS